MNLFYRRSTMKTMQDYLSVADIARARGVTSQLISHYRGLTADKIPKRYRDRFVPFPEPDVNVGGQHPGWLPHRLDELVAWKPPGPGGRGRRRKLAAAHTQS